MHDRPKNSPTGEGPVLAIPAVKRFGRTKQQRKCGCLFTGGALLKHGEHHLKVLDRLAPIRSVPGRLPLFVPSFEVPLRQHPSMRIRITWWQLLPSLSNRQRRTLHHHLHPASSAHANLANLSHSASSRKSSSAPAAL